MKLDAYDHPKMYDLARRLGKEVPHAIGTMGLLWRFAARYAKQGDVGRHSDAAIAAACHWSGEPTALIDALVDAGLVDRCTVNRLVIHDWQDHAEQFVQKWLERNEKPFLVAVKPQVPATPELNARIIMDGQNLNMDTFAKPSLATSSQATTRSLAREGELSNAGLTATQEHPATPGSQPAKPRKSRTSDNGFPSQVRALYAAYPKHVAPDKALPAIAQAIQRIAKSTELPPGETTWPPPDPVAWLTSRVKAFAASPAGNAGRFTPHPATWFNQGRYLDDPAEWQRDDARQPRGPGRGEGHVAGGGRPETFTL